MAKQVKSSGGGLDRISHLPDHILCQILTFLPIEEAVKTSILASRWRYLFASMTVLNFDGWLYSKRGKFINFVDRLMFFPSQVSLDCFRMSHVPSNKARFHLYGWICAALWRDVKQIDICLGDHPLPAHLFTSQLLVSLKLESRCDLNVPSKVCLPKLKTLHLSYFDFSNDSVFRLISSCHVLEELTLSGCTFDNITEIKIHNDSLKRLDFDCSHLKMMHYAFVLNAPNLVYFKYVGMVTESYSLSQMNSLEQVYISVELPEWHENDDAEQEQERYGTLLQAVSTVQSLHLVIVIYNDEETLLQPNLEPMPMFHNLVELQVDYSCVLWLTKFLLFTPNLKSLILSELITPEDFESLSYEPACSLLHLKEIQVLNFNGTKLMFQVISYFLSHGLVLEKLVIKMMSIYGKTEREQLRITKKQLLRITKRLLELPRKSERCRVVIL